VPAHDVHRKFVDYAPRLLPEAQSRALFDRMARRAQIDHRYSVLRPDADPARVDADGFYGTDAFPDTARRMEAYRRYALPLAKQALDRIDLSGVTHLIVTSCTGFYAPGLDLEIVAHYGLAPSVERTMIGFMGCYAAFNALKLARHIVRSEHTARVAILNLELCTLHLQQGGTLENVLSFLIFADGCAASIVSAEPQGLLLESFRTTLLPDSADQITWRIGGAGFDMTLSGKVAGSIAGALPSRLPQLLEGAQREEIALWAVHPGGRTILDAVRGGAGLPEDRLAVSRDVLRRFGNMSSATIMFVLAGILNDPAATGEGCAMAFGPGLTVESMRFQKQGA
jgi:alpha-pyrone synthase